MGGKEPLYEFSKNKISSSIINDKPFFFFFKKFVLTRQLKHLGDCKFITTNSYDLLFLLEIVKEKEF